jgi:hypothetical protein
VKRSLFALLFLVTALAAAAAPVTVTAKPVTVTLVRWPYT